MSLQAFATPPTSYSEVDPAAVSISSQNPEFVRADVPAKVRGIRGITFYNDVASFNAAATAANLVPDAGEDFELLGHASSRASLPLLLSLAFNDSVAPEEKNHA